MKFTEFKDLFELTYQLNKNTSKSFLLETKKDIPSDYKKRDISFSDTKMKLHWNGNSWTVSTYYSKDLENFKLKNSVIDADNNKIMTFTDFVSLFEPTYKLYDKTDKSFLLETTKDIPSDYKKRELTFSDTKIKLHWNGNSWTVSIFYLKELEKFNVQTINNNDDNQENIISNNLEDNTKKSTENNNISMTNIIMTSMLCSAVLTPILSSLSDN
jgi:hypothetical protein